MPVFFLAHKKVNLKLLFKFNGFVPESIKGFVIKLAAGNPLGLISRLDAHPCTVLAL